MTKLIVATILLGLCAAIVSCSVPELPAIEYIDVTNIVEDAKVGQEFIKDLVEEYGSDDPDETAKIFMEFHENLDQLIKDTSDYKVKDKFRIRTKLRNSFVYNNGLGMLRLNMFANPISQLISDPEKNANGFQLEVFLGTIKLFFGDDLSGFASGQVTHDKKLYNFLSKYCKLILSANLRKAIYTLEGRPDFESRAEALIAHDLKRGYTEDDVVRKAQRMNLVTDKFRPRSMLSSVDKSEKSTLTITDYGSTKKNLLGGLERVCLGYGVHLIYQAEIYAWSRLMIPEEVAKLKNELLFKNSPKLMDYWRVCLPVINKKTLKLVAENIKRNSSFF